MPAKGCLAFFLFVCFFICLELELFAQIKKDLVSAHPHKSGLLITQDRNKIKKFPDTLF